MSDITATVAEARKLTPAQVRRLMDTGPFLAKEALDNGLIDALSYRDEFEKTLRIKGWVVRGNRLGGCLQQVQRAGAGGRQGHCRDGHRNRCDRSKGAASGLSSRGVGSSTPTTSPKPFGTLPRNPPIVGIVVRIDSPGGSCGASDTVWRAVHVAREAGKPVAQASDPRRRQVAISWQWRPTRSSRKAGP